MRSETGDAATDAADAFTIDKVYPWGRSLDEYRLMFDLSDADLASTVLGVADGPASFNAELTRRGGHVTSCDPLYQFTGAEIRARVEATRGVMLDLVRRDAHRFVWDRIRSPEHLGEMRMRAMQTFLDDYKRGRDDGRYLDRSLPRLDFPADSFDVAICSHFLFLYSNEFPLELHLECVAVMARAARDVRIFPLLNLAGEPSPHVDPISSALRKDGFRVERRKVDYEFQRGGNEMLRVTRGA